MILEFSNKARKIKLKHDKAQLKANLHKIWKAYDVTRS